MIYSLPMSLAVGGADHAIRSDYRVILDLIEVLNDPDFSDADKAEATIQTIFPDWETLTDYSEALEKSFWFIDLGQPHGKKSVRLVDWEKDFPYIVAPVNRVLGYECRSVEYLHWWTFMGAYMEIGGDCAFSQIVSLRSKLAKGKKLEKYEREWLRQNRELVTLPTKYTAEDEEMLKKWT